MFLSHQEEVFRYIKITLWINIELNKIISNDFNWKKCLELNVRTYLNNKNLNIFCFVDIPIYLFYFSLLVSQFKWILEIYLILK